MLGVVTFIQIYASLNHRKNMEAEPSWLIPLNKSLQKI